MSTRNIPPAPDTSRRTPLSRRGLFVAAASVPAGAAVLSAAPALADPSVKDGETRIVDIPLAEVPLSGDGDAQVRELADQPATMVGVTWPNDTDAPDVQARGLGEDGEWTEWLPLETAENPETGEDAAGTEVAWVGVVSALQIRAELDGADVTESLVAHVVTTSPAPADSQVGQYTGPDARVSQADQVTTMAVAASTNPATPVLGPGAPSYVSRAAWGADESAVRGTSGADELKAVVLHHTAGSNNYSSSQSAQIVRGIFDYHTRVQGWADIGYNILVSKYGQIFEGRSGGLHRTITGAHAYGFNTGSFGISVMGDYSSTAPPRAARVAVAQLVGWKLLSTFQTSVWGKSSWTPGTGTRFTAGKTISLAKMMGHRDVNFTECPGVSLYREFDTIRGEAQAFIDGGWREHLWAFEGAGGSSTLGTVIKSAHRTGKYTATVLTKGLVLQEGGAAAGHATPFAEQWRAAWGRPTGSASTRFGQTVQTFQQGAVVKTGSSVQFHDSRFIDVPPNLMYREEIEELAAEGITTGWKDDSYYSYRPLAPIQRDAMVAFVYRALGKPAFTPPTKSPFTDMPPSRQFYKEITWAHAEGITTGWSDGTFRPTAPVERGAVAAFLYRASRERSTKTTNPFSDVPSTHQFGKEITWLASTGITTGWPDGTFRPVAPIARDAMAAFMIRWMDVRGL